MLQVIGVLLSVTATTKIDIWTRRGPATYQVECPYFRPPKSSHHRLQQPLPKFAPSSTARNPPLPVSSQPQPHLPGLQALKYVSGKQRHRKGTPIGRLHCPIRVARTIRRRSAAQFLIDSEESHKKRSTTVPCAGEVHKEKKGDGLG